MKRTCPATFAKSIGAWTLSAGLACSASPVRAQSVSETPKVAPTSALEEIVVTAQKRDQRLQDVPISVTAFTTAAIETNRIQNVKDLSSIAPNLTVFPLVGGSQAPVYSMRGIVALGSLPGEDKGISLYVDGVYLSANNGSIFDIADIARIEVLKGPQGTLFGRNSTGGAISITTQLPKGVFGAKQDLTYGNYDQFKSKTRVDFPAIGPLSLALTYLHNQRRGDIRNLGASTQWNYSVASGGQFGILTSPKYLGNENTDAVGVAARLQPSDGLEIIYRYDLTDRHFTETGQGILSLAGFNPLTGAAAASGIILGQPASNVGNLTPITTRRPDAVNNGFTTPGYLRSQGHSLTGTYAVTDSLTVKDIAAYRTTRLIDTSEVSGAGGLVLPGPAAAGGGLPIVLYGILNNYRQKQWSNETQFSLNLPSFKLTAGYLFFAEDIIGGGVPGVGSTIAFQVIPGRAFTTVASFNATIANSRSNALFSQAEYSLGDKLTLVGGLRQTWDHKFGNDFTVFGGPFDEKSNKLTWLGGINFKPNSSTLIYAKASTGYISGGEYNGSVYAPETALSYEGGIKADFLGHRLRTNLAVFHVKYSDLQFLLASPTGIIVANAGTARAWGAEFEGSVVPVSGVTLNAGIGYTNFKYLSLLPGIGTIGSYRPDDRPKLTTTLGAQYETPNMAWGGKVLFHLDAQYKSKINGVPLAATPESTAATTFSPQWLLNGRVALTEVPIGKVKAQVAIWARNLTDNKDAIYTTDIRFIYPGSYQPARTFGIDLSLQI